MRFVKQLVRYFFWLTVAVMMVALTGVNWYFASKTVSFYSASKLESMGASVDMSIGGPNCCPTGVYFSHIELDSSTCKEKLYRYLYVFGWSSTPIRVLRLNMPEIGEGAGLWETLPNLLWKVEYLDLSDTLITDEAIRPLEGLSFDWKCRLKSLDVTGTQITPEGVKKLKTLFPQCEIYHDDFMEEK
ncbi:MAG: hypothetical protein Q4C70_03900 [Planctomycetia bacterium]|nr:hypothetical protein [Planctomycetia bacterium]